MTLDALLQAIQNATQKVTLFAWALFLLTWSIGWTLRGAPIPLSRLKRVGSGFIEDSIWAALWLALGSTVFTLITYIAQLLAG